MTNAHMTDLAYFITFAIRHQTERHWKGHEEPSTMPPRERPVHAAASLAHFADRLAHFEQYCTTQFEMIHELDQQRDRQMDNMQAMMQQLAEEFRANADDDPKRAEFWLENSIRVLDELSCTPNECLRCAISLLRDEAYHWWTTLIFVVLPERVTWQFFQEEFRKKYISERFIEKKRKEFLELKQGCMTVSEYEREFVRLRKYAQDCVPSETKMCRRFEDRLNQDIKTLVCILELKIFLVLVERDCKAENLVKKRKKGESNARDTRKRYMNKSLPFQTKKFREMYSRSHVSAGQSYGNRSKQNSSFRSRATSVASVGNAKPSKAKCLQCSRRYSGNCRVSERSCFKCGS
ncbi:uncharacterized protein [Gossypium hirsutum]|uniref:Retrotransposon gag domain-containing protein n=1 Tax=Gossypium hirsutum TaxID=3635 RepID=A0A1U8NG82_GOSHI|nr:uncharacterized protein LOC107948049 [Gossypium hirsutum]